MAIILNIETATKNCSVCLSDNEKILSLVEFNEGQFSHAEKLHSFILDVLKQSKKSMQDIDAIAVSKGPGSYTGLRIGVSAAKGLCFALDKPLISISTLDSLSHIVDAKKGEFIIPLLDARRMEVYSAVYDDQHFQIREIRAEIIDENSFADYLNKGKVFMVGDGAAKCAEVIDHKNANYLKDVLPSAKEMAKLSSVKYQNNEFEDVAYFEPFYLKDFIAGIPKKMFL